MACSGTRQSLKERLAVMDARIDIFPCSSDDVNPGVPLSTRNPRIPSSARAHTTAISAMEPLVIHVFSPLITQHEPCLTARVNMPAGFDPKPGSVNPKHPTASPDWSFG